MMAITTTANQLIISSLSTVVLLSLLLHTNQHLGECHPIDTKSLSDLQSAKMSYTPAQSNYENLLSLKPKSAENAQRDAVVGLVKRLLPQHAHLIEVIVDSSLSQDSHDYFKVESINNKTLRILGNTGVSAANGLHYYLKYVANCSISWSGDQLALPHGKLPMPSQPIEMTIREKFRYYQNVCTASYTTVWWDWVRWEREIDWMALHGINLPLAFNGQEIIFRNTFLQFGLTKDQVDNYFSGPAFLAWNRMGNIQSWSGPLTEHWHQHQMDLQKKILERMRSLGMFPVVPGFAGRIPRDLVKVIPNANISQMTDWAEFGPEGSETYFLEPEDPIFGQISKTFILEYTKMYGTDHFYNIDLFNEISPPTNDPNYLRRCGKGIYQSLIQADPQAIWVMQGWLFYHEATFWGKPQVEAMVTSVPQGRMLILDLFSEIIPVYEQVNGYHGQPFIWCMLHNFGGTLGMYGAFTKINEKVYSARKTYPNMLGIGLTPEGIEQNEIMYDYMTEVTWYDSVPDMSHWVQDYTHRRYGFTDSKIQQAWELLRSSVYDDRIGFENHGQYAINVLPRLDLKNYTAKQWYDPQDVSQSLRLLAQYTTENPGVINQSETFVYDIVDVTRQTLQLLFDHYYEKLMVAFEEKDSGLKLITGSLEQILDLAEEVLRGTRYTLLYHWVDNARKLGADAKEKDFNEWQARNQISIWGPKANIRDYAAKHWSGMMKYYYKPRWQLFFAYLQKDLQGGAKFDQDKFTTECFERVELTFTHAKAQELVKKPDTSRLVDIVNQVVQLAANTIDKSINDTP